MNTDSDDHAADALRYALTLRQPETERQAVGAGNYQDRERGWHRDGTPRRPHVLGFDEEHERHLAETEGSGFRSGMRWEPDL